jgi:short-subunit dehydrogenase
MGERRTALVTGASSGIGAAVARNLAARGHDCVLAARRKDRLEALAQEIEKAHGVRAHALVADLGARGGAEQLVADVAAVGAPVDVLVNNAGFGVYGNFWEHDSARVMQMVELNMVSLTTLTHHYAKQMVERRSGRILQVASVGAYQPSPLYAVYSATKAYVLFFSQAANHELRGTGVSVTTVCPGLTDTEFHEVAAHVKPKWMDMITMTADDVAEVGLSAMMRGRSVVTPGFANKLNAFLIKLMPRSWATWAAGRTMQSKR